MTTITSYQTAEAQGLEEPRVELLRIAVLTLGGAFICWQLAVIYAEPTACCAVAWVPS